MLIGKAGPAETSIAMAHADRVEVRGRDLTSNLMGRVGFTEYFFLLLTGREPTEQQRYFLDLLLVAIAEHGLVPSVQAARMTLAADPAALQGAVAAGILGAGSVILGAAEHCGRLLMEARRRILAGEDEDTALQKILLDLRARGERTPGFGHPLHRPVDPRAERILALAAERGLDGPHLQLARRLPAIVAEVTGKRLPMNVSMPIAAVLLDLEFPGPMIKAIPILARTASLLAHLAEEQQTPDRLSHGLAWRGRHPLCPGSAGGGGAMISPEVEALPWEDQAGADDAAYRAQVAYLFEHSAFYRDKLRAAGFPDAASVGGLAEIARLPFTEKDELRASASPEFPMGAHVAAEPRRIVRIYSTSGTTGTPSYIPLTSADIESWHVISARSYGASGLTRGEKLISTYGAGPFVAGATLEAFEKLGLVHIPVGPGNTERLMAAVERLQPQAIALTPSYAFHLLEWARQRGIDTSASSVEHLLVAGEPGGGEPAMRAQLEEGWGAVVTEAMGIGDVAVSLWGECEAKGGMHFSGRGFVHVELIDPITGAALPLVDGARGELVYTHLRREAAPLLRFRSRDHVEVRMGACACGRTAPRVRCIGRTDDMLIVRGVNVFPTAVREVVNQFAPEVSGAVQIRPRSAGVAQQPPLPIRVELAEGRPAVEGFAERIRARIRDTLSVTTEIELLPWGSLPRSDYKGRLVDRSDAK